MNANFSNRTKQKALIILIVVLIAVISKATDRDEQQERLVQCKLNLRNLGTAMEIYSTDWSGRYPSRLSDLVPNYVDALPFCPTVDEMTYRMESGPEASHNPDEYQDYFYLYCRGHNHKSVGCPKDYLNYDGITGVLER